MIQCNIISYLTISYHMVKYKKSNFFQESFLEPLGQIQLRGNNIMQLKKLLNKYIFFNI